MNKKSACLIIILLIISSLAAFGRIAGNDFINLDDTGYITKNRFVQSGISPQSIKWAFTAAVEKNWVPMTMISHMLAWSLFGENASGHLMMNLLLHIGAVIFLFLFLYKTTGNLLASAFAAAFFSLHPLRVESVAWASERKDVLSLFFGMAALYAYAFYAKKPGWFPYAICLMLFALSLLSKSMLVTLPFVFLLLDYWPLKRWNILSPAKDKGGHSTARLIGEKTPFFLLTIAVSIITLWAQHEADPVYPPLLTRLSNASIAYVIYLKNTFRPVDLALSYYYVDFPLWQIAVSGFILIGITLAVIYTFKKLPFLLTGWFWYLGTLVPVIGLVPTNALMTDHYTYLPSIGIAIMLSWGIPLLFRRRDFRVKILFPSAIAVLSVLTILTWRQCGYWKNSTEIFSHTLRVTENNYMAHDKLGVAFAQKGEIDKALYHHSMALHINPQYAIAYNNRGMIYLNQGLYQQALDDFNSAVALKPYFTNAYNNRGVLYDYLDKNQLAVQDYSTAIRLKADFALAYKNRACVYFKMGDIVSGCEDARKACQLKECGILRIVQKQGFCR